MRTEHKVGVTWGMGQVRACWWPLEIGKSRKVSSLKPSEGKNLHWNNAFKFMMSKNVRKGDLL